MYIHIICMYIYIEKYNHDIRNDNNGVAFRQQQEVLNIHVGDLLLWFKKHARHMQGECESAHFLVVPATFFIVDAQVWDVSRPHRSQRHGVLPLSRARRLLPPWANGPDGPRVIPAFRWKLRALNTRVVYGMRLIRRPWKGCQFWDVPFTILWKGCKFQKWGLRKWGYRICFFCF